MITKKLIGSAPVGQFHKDHRFKIETLNVNHPVWFGRVPNKGEGLTVTGTLGDEHKKLENMVLIEVETLGLDTLYMFELANRILSGVKIERRIKGSEKIVSTAQTGYMIFRDRIYIEISVYDPTHLDALGAGKFYWLYAEKGLPKKKAMRLQLSDKGAKSATFRQLPAEFTPVLRSSDNEKTELLPTLAGLPWQEPFSLGVGVDAVTGATAGRAVKSFDPELETIMTSSERINFVQSESDLTREIELMAKGEYNVSNIKSKRIDGVHVESQL